MADKDKGGDKTELPTPKKLKDARKKGDIAKAREITATVGTFGFLAILFVLGGQVAGRIAAYADRVVSGAAQGDFATTATTLAWDGVILLIMLVALIVVPMMVLGTLAEFLQTRGLFASEKLSPKFENLNPVEGFKRLFGKQGLVELTKTLAKVLAIVAVVWLVARQHIEGIGELLVPAGLPVWYEGAGAGVALEDAGRMRGLTLQVVGWVALIFVLIAAIDMVWARHSFIKRMMMSRRDIQQEVKQDEGDPHIKGHRRQLAQEWAQSGAIARTGDAAALLVNPTHIAIALEYDADTTPIPVVLARGEEAVALAMRVEAERVGVPIVRHIPTARSLWARGEIGEMVPEDMFDAVAEVILWARRAKEGKAPMDCDLEREIAAREADVDLAGAAA